MTGSVGPEGLPNRNQYGRRGCQALATGIQIRAVPLLEPQRRRHLRPDLHGADRTDLGLRRRLLAVGRPLGAVYVITAIVMTFSALSYREMALQFPVAGSVYSYVRLGTSTFIGFISGWAILLDYLLLPALLCVFASVAMASLVPFVPGWAWVIVFVVATALINIMGVTVTAR